MHLEMLRDARKRRGLTLKELGEKLGVTAPQIQRVEQGKRRISLEMLERYCDALELDPIDVIRGEVQVPIIGVIDADSNVLPLTPNTSYTTRAPNIVPHPERLSAVRWEATGQFTPMHGHLMFFYADVGGIPEDAWSRRCVIRRENGTLRIGWPIKEGGQTHIDDVTGRVEFNAKIEWASPALAVIAPQLLSA